MLAGRVNGNDQGPTGQNVLGADEKHVKRQRAPQCAERPTHHLTEPKPAARHRSRRSRAVSARGPVQANPANPANPDANPALETSPNLTQLWHDQTEDYGGQCDGLDTNVRIPASAWPEALTPKCPWIRPQRAGYSAYGGGYHSQRVPFER